MRDGRITRLKAKYEARSRAPDAVEVEGDVVAASLGCGLWMQMTWVSSAKRGTIDDLGCCSIAP